jgi:hypothetical protein
MAGELDVIGMILGAINNFLLTMGSQASLWISQAVTNMMAFFAQAVVETWNLLSATFRQVTDYLWNVFQNLNNFLGDIINGIVSWFSRAWDVFLAKTIEVVGRIGQYISDAMAWIRSIAQSIINGVSSAFTAVINTIVSVATAVVNGIAGFIVAVRETLVGGITAIIADAVATYQKAVQTIENLYNKLLLGVDSTLEALAKKFSDINKAVKEAADTLSGNLNDISEEMLTPIVKAFKAVAAPYEDLVTPEFSKTVLGAFAEITSANTLYTPTRKVAEAQMKKWFSGSGPFALVAKLLLLVITVGSVFAGIASANASMLQQEFGVEHPYSLFAQSDVAALLSRGVIGEDESVATLRRYGFSEAQAKQLLWLRFNYPTPVEALALKGRGLIGDDLLNESYNAAGIPDKWKKPISDAWWQIPPPQDLISMAVREAWNESWKTTWGHSTEFPKEVGEWCSKVGLSADWAMKYWEAHWDLPSVLMGYEMFHRGIISEEDLNGLMKALDILPGWRDRLIKMSYNVLTRVDVRRMHKVGELSEDEVEREYLNMGYSPVDAVRLRRFTVTLNNPPAADDPDELGKLTRSVILDWYKDGVLAPERAIKLLTDLKYTMEAANTFVMAIDHDKERAERKAEVELTVQLANAGTLTWDEAQDRLSYLGLETAEIAAAVAELSRAQQAKSKLPSEANAQAWYAAGILSEPDFRELLSRYGYAPHWVEMFILAKKVKVPGNA